MGVRPLAVISCLVCLFAAPSLAAAQTTGAIAGRVTGAGQVGFSVRVGVYRAATGLGDARLVAIVDVNPTEHDYQITGLTPGSYFVRTHVPEQSPFVDVWYPAVTVGAAAGAQTVTVSAGVTTSDVNMSLVSDSGTISGSLTLARLPFTGQVILPVVRAYNEQGILVRQVAGLMPQPGATAGSPITADPPAGGTFTWRIPGLPAGRYYVRTSNPSSPAPNNGHVAPSGGYWIDELYADITCVAADCVPSRGTPIDVTAGAGGTGGASIPSVDISLDYGAIITGATPPATFLATQQVELYDSRGILLPERTAPALSGYVATGLPAGTYFLKLLREQLGKYPAVLYKDMPCNGCAVTSGTPVVLAAGETKTGIDFIELPDRAISGTVRSGGLGIANVTVEAFAPNGALAGTAVTAADGTYSIAGLNPGTYYLRTSNTLGYADMIHMGHQCSGCDPLTGTPIALTGTADVIGIDFDLAQGGDLAAQLLVQVVGPTIKGVPTISFYGAGGVPVTIYTPANTVVAQATSDAFGKATRTIAPGTYYLQVGPADRLPTQRYAATICPQGICDAGTGTSIPVSASTQTAVTYNVSYSCEPASIAPVTLASAAVGVRYRQTMAVTGGLTPNRFSIASGTLPAGLTLDASTGVISGTPTASGHYTFTVAAEKTNGCAVTRQYILDVPACVVSVPSSVTSRASGEPFLIHVTATCSSWSASSNTSWISVGARTSDAVVIITSPYSGTTPRTGSVTIGSSVLPVYQNGTSPQLPFGVLEAPDNGAVVTGSIAVSGWALDDLAIVRVVIYRDPIAGEGAAQIFLGEATIVEGARPDVAAAFPTMPRNTRAGYGYLLLTNMLPHGGNGTFVVYAYADDADGNRVLLGNRIFSATNATATVPFGAIDTPGQGEVIAGENYVNFGWALTPQPAMIPVDGSTIRVVVDGVPVGPLSSYSLFRSDVASLFPGLKNSAGPVGFRIIDTTTLSEGVHTIAWGATDDRGQSTGIGSRYFTVRNSAWTPSLKLSSPVTPPAFTRADRTLSGSMSAVPARIDGIDTGRRVASLDALPSDDDGRVVRLRALQRLELKLADEAAEECSARFEGYVDAAGELQALPPGASLDAAGTFYWQPGPAFHGTYRLVFVRTACDGSRKRLPVSVHIR